MRILIVDAFDSFVYNLYQYMGSLGADVKVVRVNKCEIPAIRAYSPDYIVLSPGPGHPKDSGFIPIIREFEDVPMFGVCLGHQAMGLAFGGEVGRAGNIMHGKTSLIEHDGKTIFMGVKNPFKATRYHSLVVRNPPKELEVSAKSREDGEIMALRHRKRACEGVQFHPESILTKPGKRMLKNFLEYYR